MLMMDNNTAQIADLIEEWIKKNVESKRSANWQPLAAQLAATTF